MPPPATPTLRHEQALRSIIEIASQALVSRRLDTPRPKPTPDPTPKPALKAQPREPNTGPPPRASNPRPDVGTNWRKHPSGRTCQISAITDTHAILYWPDADHPGATHPAQTQVRLDRFTRTREWEPLP